MKYLEAQTTISKSSKLVDFVTSPAITLVPLWNTDEHWSRASERCLNISQTSDEVWSCFQNISHDVNTFILKENYNGTWRTELTDPVAGNQCYQKISGIETGNQEK